MLYGNHVLIGGDNVNPFTQVTTGWRLPGSAGQSGAAPQVPWGSVNNILATGGAFAVSQLDYPFEQTQILRGYNFNFSAESIPGGATITNLEVEIARNILVNSGTPTITDGTVIWQDDYTAPSVVGINLASSETWPVAVDAGVAGTAATYSWSTPAQGALTKAILEGANFAITIVVKHGPGDDGDGYARVDSIRCRATYYY